MYLHMENYINVGNFIIKLIDQNYDLMKRSLPDRALQFLYDGSFEGKTIIDYRVSLKESMLEEFKGELIANFDKSPRPYEILDIGSGKYLWIRKNFKNDPILVFCISKNWNRWTLLLGKREDAFEELVYIFSYSILKYNNIIFHGIVMEWNNIGVIVCAHSGVGKTTHTRMWCEIENAEILNGDRALCAKEDDNWYAYGAPWCGSSNECKNKKIKLQAIVLLKRGEKNEITQISPLQGALELIQLAFAPSWDKERMNMALNVIDNLTLEIPIYQFKCLPNPDAVITLKEEILRSMPVYNK